MKKRWLAAILAACMFTGNIQGTGFFLNAQAAQTELETEETNKAEETEKEEAETEEKAAEEEAAEKAESKEPETEKVHEAEAEKQLQEDAGEKSSESSDPDPLDPAENAKQSETGTEVSDSDDPADKADPAQPQELQQTSEQEEENRNIQEEETEKKKDKKSDSGIVWKSAHAPLVQGGDMVAEHFTSEDPADKKSGSKYSRKPAMSALQKGSALTRAQAVEGLKAKFAEAFSAYAHNVDISDFELYRKDYTEEGLDGEAVITEAYQTAVSGEHFFITGDFKIGASEETGLIREVSIGYGKIIYH